MKQSKTEVSKQEAYKLACNFYIALDTLAENCPELRQYAENANTIAQGLGRLWSGDEEESETK